ncbi:MAG TPA: inositol-3-phosphate synthase, partial [Planctomycetota bacterium]
MSPDASRTGLFIVGARGAVASTVLHGLEGLRSGMPPVGLVTSLPEFGAVPFRDPCGFRLHGWDVAGDIHRTAEDLARTNVLPRDLVEMCAGLRERVQLSLAPGVPEPEDSEIVDPAAGERLLHAPSEAIEALRRDIRGWMKEERLQHAVVVYLATVERKRTLPEGWMDPAADPMELAFGAPATISRSLLYGVAAVAEGLPFINFTPAPGPQVPAFACWAERKGVPVLGSDGKTGETLLKTALAPMFRDRALNVLSW